MKSILLWKLLLSHRFLACIFRLAVVADRTANSNTRMLPEAFHYMRDICLYVILKFKFARISQARLVDVLFFLSSMQKNSPTLPGFKASNYFAFALPNRSAIIS